MATPGASRNLQPLQCMEIWGGNTTIDNGVSLAGIDCWVYSRPFSGREAVSAAGGADSGGGDIHFVTSCAMGRMTRLVVADVSGHGAPVSELAASLRRLMRKHSNHYDKRVFVGAVNERFSEIFADTQEASASGIFATGLFGTYFAPTDELTISSAGHPRPLHFDARRGVWSAIDVHAAPGAKGGPSNLPLGVLGEAAYDQRTVRLGRDDLVLVYSDALLEVRLPASEAAAAAPDSRPRVRMLGEQGLIDLCSRVDPRNADGFIASLLDQVRAAAQDRAGFDDDVTILLLRRNDLKPRAGLLSSFRAGFNLLRGMIDSARRGLPVSIPDLSAKAFLGSMFARFNTPQDPRG